MSSAGTPGVNLQPANLAANKFMATSASWKISLKNDQAGVGGGAVAQSGGGNSDPSAAALQMAAAQAQKQQQANQDENATTAAV